MSSAVLDAFSIDELYGAFARQALLEHEIIVRSGLVGAEKTHAIKGLQAMREAGALCWSGVLQNEPDQGFRQAESVMEKAAADGNRREQLHLQHQKHQHQGAV